MKVRVIYFAAVRDLVGVDEETLVWSGESTVGALISGLEEKYERLSMEGVRVALNEEFAGLEEDLSDGDVVALIPPVSGG